MQNEQFHTQLRNSLRILREASRMLRISASRARLSVSPTSFGDVESLIVAREREVRTIQRLRAENRELRSAIASKAGGAAPAGEPTGTNDDRKSDEVVQAIVEQLNSFRKAQIFSGRMADEAKKNHEKLAAQQAKMENLAGLRPAALHEKPSVDLKGERKPVLKFIDVHGAIRSVEVDTPGRYSVKPVLAGGMVHYQIALAPEEVEKVQ